MIRPKGPYKIARAFMPYEPYTIDDAHGESLAVIHQPYEPDRADAVACLFAASDTMLSDLHHAVETLTDAAECLERCDNIAQAEECRAAADVFIKTINKATTLPKVPG